MRQGDSGTFLGIMWSIIVASYSQCIATWFYCSHFDAAISSEWQDKGIVLSVLHCADFHRTFARDSDHFEVLCWSTISTIANSRRLSSKWLVWELSPTQSAELFAKREDKTLESVSAVSIYRYIFERMENRQRNTVYEHHVLLPWSSRVATLMMFFRTRIFPILTETSGNSLYVKVATSPFFLLLDCGFGFLSFIRTLSV